MAEEKPEQKTAKKEDKVEKKSGVNFWMVSTLVLVVIVLIVVGFSLTGAVTKANNGSNGNVKVLSSDEISSKAKAYIEQNLLPPNSTITIMNATESNGVYLVTTSYQGREIPLYVTKDGTYMFLSAVDITKPLPTSTDQTQPTQTQKTDKPVVELFVMSFCPYGVQAEEVMKPVYDLLKNAADFKIRFIVNIGGNTTASVQSLHGSVEAEEDLRQVCIQKNYPDKYWDYVAEFDSTCYPKGRDPATIDACWKATAAKFGINATKIATCSNSTEGLSLLAVDEQISNQYGVSGSPTLVINGGQYSGDRSPDAFKQGICDAFNTAPSACSQAVGSGNSSSAASTGGCAT